MSYLIYGKMTERWYSKIDHKWHEPDKTFKALNWYGVRVNKLCDAAEYATYEDAKNKLEKETKNHKKKAIFEIRKAK